MSITRNGFAVSWIHFGDLHVTGEHEQNYRDFLTLIDQVNFNLAGRVDFAVLPGDNAEDGAPDQFRLVRRALDRLQVPVHILPGDHDCKPGCLEGFHQFLGAERLPKAITISGRRCLFLDVVSKGGGGSDFRLGSEQLKWLRNELVRAGDWRERCLIFMHCYPADLTVECEEVADLFHRHRVGLVDTGHTHYNELVNDGSVIYAATRSTGQIEEGPPGFSIVTSAGDVVSWKFKELNAAWPFVQVTAPSDYRLITDPSSPNHIVRETCFVCAKVWSKSEVVSAECRIDSGSTLVMDHPHGEPHNWRCASPTLDDGLHRVTVRVRDASGATAEDTITIFVSRSGRYDPPKRIADGSDADSIGPWPEKGILGTQLGPNKNGRKW